MTKLILNLLARKILSLHKDEDGAALMITLAVILFLYLLCSATYAIGSTVHEKIQLQNAADAAAYSAAVVEADGLSRIATINRAMSWTYVQMVRQHMDYIVYKWLDLTQAHCEQDRTACSAFNNYVHFASHTDDQGLSKTEYRTYNFLPTGRCPRHNNIIPAQITPCSTHQVGAEDTDGSIGTWWCGWTPGDGNLIRLGYTAKSEKDFGANVLHGGFLQLAAIQNSVGNIARSAKEQGYDSADEMFKKSIENSREIMGNLTLAMVAQIQAMNKNMQDAAVKVLVDNLPIGYEGDEYRFSADFPVFAYPYVDTATDSGNLIQSVLSAVKNTEEDELEFLSASMATSSLQEIWGDGIDQWFIRGKLRTLSRDELSFSLGIDDYAGRGLQRGYKSANRVEAGGASDRIYRGNHVAYGTPLLQALNVQTIIQGGVPGGVKSLALVLPNLIQATSILANAATILADIIPSCANKKELFVEQCRDIKDNFGLVSEYHWASMRWWCPQVSFWFYVPPTWYRPDYWSFCFSWQNHYKVAPMVSCSHVLGSRGSHLRSNYNPCFMGMDNLHPGILPQDRHGSSNRINGYLTQGYTRIYGDDKRIYDANYYNTMEVQPVKLNRQFFQQKIRIAIAKKQTNPFRWMFPGNAGSSGGNRSVFSIFDPVTNNASWITAVSAATAAVREHDSSNYDTKFNQISSYEFDSDSGDSSTINLRLPDGRDEQLARRYRVGCPHNVKNNGVVSKDSPNTPEITERLARSWNLCETDWIAVFAPVRYASDDYTAAYDAAIHDTKSVKYKKYPANRANGTGTSYLQRIARNSSMPFWQIRIENGRKVMSGPFSAETISSVGIPGRESFYSVDNITQKVQ